MNVTLTRSTMSNIIKISRRRRSNQITCVALVNPQDPYPLTFTKTKKAKKSFEVAWNKAHEIVEKTKPEYWDYDDVQDEMEKMGYKSTHNEFVWGD